MMRIGFGVLIVLAVCAVNAEDTVSRRQAVRNRNAVQMQNMLLALPNSGACGRFFWTKFGIGKYGNYCGLGGSGTPINAVDNCCKVHDECYGKASEDMSGCSWFQRTWKTHPISWTYKWKSDAGKLTCTGDFFGRECSQKNANTCECGACVCDQVFAECMNREFEKTPCPSKALKL